MTDPLSTDEEVIYVRCPKCERRHEDHDGFGVLFCNWCGYCTHSSITNGACDFCGEREPDAYEAIGESRFGLPGGGGL